jgi:hypothetical protein
MYIYTFLLRMTDTMTSQNIDLSSRDTLYSVDDRTTNKCGTVGGMRIGGENPAKPTSMPLCIRKVWHGLG